MITGLPTDTVATLGGLSLQAMSWDSPAYVLVATGPTFVLVGY